MSDISNNKIAINDTSVLEEACAMVMRQTDYTREIAINKLLQYDMNTEIIVREWMGVPVCESKKMSNNQKVFQEFRTFLDDAAFKYYKNKDT